MAPTFTVVCVYNSEATLEAYLRRGLSRQTAPFDLRLVDNRERRFSSAAAALNEGARGAKSDYLVFIHQDVELLDPKFFEHAGEHLRDLPNIGIAGVVGATGASGFLELRGRCLQGDQDAAGYSPGFSTPLPVQTVDEQVLIVPTSQFRTIPFDTLACPAWDLYGVEYALECAKRGRDVRVLPLAVRHASWGKLRLAYFESLARVQAKHPEVADLYTTCGTWRGGRAAWLHWASHQLKAGKSRFLSRLVVRRFLPRTPRASTSHPMD